MLRMWRKFYSKVNLFFIAAILFGGGFFVCQAQTSTLNRTLSYGDTGMDVSVLQSELRTLGYFTFPKNTGYFGTITQNAVKAFQKAYGIVSTGDSLTTGYGRVGPLTLKALNDYQSMSLPGMDLKTKNENNSNII